MPVFTGMTDFILALRVIRTKKKFEFRIFLKALRQPSLY